MLKSRFASFLSRLRTPSTRLLYSLAVLCILAWCGERVSLNHADPDLWGHVQFGRDVLRDGAIAATTTYSSFLPEKSYDESCVFQGPVGCTLPGEIRSVTCNRFLCEPIINLQIELRADSASQQFAILSHRMEAAK